MKNNNSTSQRFNASTDVRPVDFSTGSDVVIRVENLSKSYLIGHQSQERYTALRDVLTNGAKNFGKRLLHPFKNAQSGLVAGDETEEFCALKDVSFEIKRGDRVGIIGRNGAGKSTLLKVLSRITEPTKGRVTIDGRVASLLEVGTGFHPELTGRENIFLNGAILGMTKAEIRSKFDEIVAFAEVDKFLDTPVKRYSSGMYVRLAFSVAAHLEPEILIVDEVLAVGDTQFQKKCLGKMEEVGKEGRTVLFVSHNMGAINQLCAKSILLHDGQIKMVGDTESVTKCYLTGGVESVLGYECYFKEDLSKDFQLVSACLKGQEGDPRRVFSCDEKIQIEMEFCSRRPVPGLYGYLSINLSDGTPVLVSDTFDALPNSLESLAPGRYTSTLNLPARFLAAGEYIVYLSFASNQSVSGFYVDAPEEVCAFTLEDLKSMRGNNRKGHFSVLLNWNLEKK